MFLNIFHIYKKRLKLNLSLLSFNVLQNLSYFFILNMRRCINFILIKNNCINIFIKKDYIFDVCFFLKNSMFIFCNQLLDITLVDRIEFVKTNFRWEFIYVLLSTFLNKRIFVRGFLKNFNFLVSIVKIFNSANWLEREIWDMFGIYIKDHPDLRRILTDYSFLGSPLRKDFPLNGYVEVRYDENLKIVVVEPLTLMQELREFRLENVWKSSN